MIFCTVQCTTLSPLRCLFSLFTKHWGGVWMNFSTLSDANRQGSVELLRQALLYLYHWSRHQSSCDWANRNGSLTIGEAWHTSTHTLLVTKVSNQLCDFVIAIDWRDLYPHTYTHTHTESDLSAETNYREWEDVIVQHSLLSVSGHSSLQSLL